MVEISKNLVSGVSEEAKTGQDKEWELEQGGGEVILANKCSNGQRIRMLWSLCHSS